MAPIRCGKYEPLPGSRRCRHYLANGACALPEEFMCVEWLRANGHVQRPEPPTPAPLARDLFGAPYVQPGDGRAAGAPGATALEAVAAQALEAEVRVESEDLGELWLVPSYTGLNRLELSFEHAAIVARLCAAMPTTRVTALVRSKRSTSA